MMPYREKIVLRAIVEERLKSEKDQRNRLKGGGNVVNRRSTRR